MFTPKILLQNLTKNYMIYSLPCFVHVVNFTCANIQADSSLSTIHFKEIKLGFNEYLF